MASATGTSSKSYQDALDKAIASAVKKAGPDGSVKWTVKAASGSASSTKAQFKVTIESTVD